ncbi:MAG: phosphonatase-like hydrolase [bacterium]|nr:phosphonatase-like hydrolase [Betaproteobacteria bacterium]
MTREPPRAAPALPIRLAVFDMAGTTIQDTGVVPLAFDAALASQGLSATASELNAIRGAGKREAIRHLVRLRRGDADLDRHAEAVYDAFRAQLDQRFRAGGARPVQGALDVFDRLRSRGVAIVLNTGFDRDTQALVLAAVGWDKGPGRAGVADALVCGDDVPLGRPAPYMIFRAMERTGVTSVTEVLNIGDTVLDIQSGVNAGCGVNVAVWSGAHSREQLEREPGAHLIADVSQLPALLERLSGGAG